MSKSIEVGERGLCVYCGDAADSIDHLIPLCTSIYGGKKRKTKHIEDAGPIANACRLCNSTLNSRMFESFWERTEWMHTWLENRAGTIDYNKRDLVHYDYTLRTLIEASRNKAVWMRCRTDWFESREFFLNLESLIWKLEKWPKLRYMFQTTVDRTKWELYLRKLE